MVKTEISETTTDLMPGGFEGFYRQWFPSVARAVALVVRDVDQGQEIAQEGFARLWRKWDTMSSPDHARNFVFKVSLNEARSHLRRRRPLRLLAMERQADDVSPDAATGVTDRLTVFRAIGALSPRQRACVVLVDYLGHDAASAGLLLGMRPSTVRVQLMRGRARLREELGEER
jgi:RNA polymerase sigma factor (sigma-70 family)